MLIEITDAGLVERIGHGGDLEAESEFCRRMAPRVRLYALRHLRNEDAAQDLVQQVLITTLEALRASRLREPGKLASFVLGTCRLTLLDFRRGAQRREKLLDLFGHELAPAESFPNLTLDQGRLQRCMESLRERERTVVVMTFYAEQPASEVASALGLSEANVRVIRHRALSQLRACMGVPA